MHYIIYRVTNKVNGKEYTGKHMTNNIDDGYMGSGKYIKRSIKKHGLENFVKEILYILDSEEEMNAKEKELVTEEYCDREDTYNICPGGQGGWGYINQNGISLTEKHASAAKENAKKATEKLVQLMKDDEWKRSFCKIIKETHYSKKHGYINPFKNKRHSQSYIDSVKGHKKQCGKKNSQYGTMWITNGIENKKIKKEELDFWVDKGYYKGRVVLA